MGLHYSIAIFFATLVGILFNFVTYSNLVFGKRDQRLIWRFIAIYGVLFVVNITVVFFFLSLFHNVYVANALAMVFNTVLGFYFNKRYVYEEN